MNEMYITQMYITRLTLLAVLLTISWPGHALAADGTTMAQADILKPVQVASKRPIRGMPPLFESPPDPDSPGRFVSFTATGCRVSFAVPGVRGLAWSGGCAEGRAQGSGTLMIYDYESQPVGIFEGAIERGRRINGVFHGFERRDGKLAGTRSSILNGAPQGDIPVAFLDMPRSYLLALDDWNRQTSGENLLASMGVTWASGSQSSSASASSPAPRQGGGRLDPQQIAACSSDIQRTQVDSQRWQGSVDDNAARLGQFQKALFEGRCAGHPEAAAYIAGANKMIGYGGNAARSSGGSLPSLSASGSAETSRQDASRTHKVHNPAADARGCVRPIKDTQRTSAGTSGNWRFVNECNSTVEIFWCFVQTDGGCRAGGTWTVHAGKGWPTFGDQPIKWGACRGRNGGGFDTGGDGGRYTCHLMSWD